MLVTGRAQHQHTVEAAYRSTDRIEFNVHQYIVCLFVCLLLNGTSALFRPLVPRIVEVEQMRYVKNDL